MSNDGSSVGVVPEDGDSVGGSGTIAIMGCAKIIVNDDVGVGVSAMTGIASVAGINVGTSVCSFTESTGARVVMLRLIVGGIVKKSAGATVGGRVVTHGSAPSK